jgi:hypothetical protein
MSDPEKASITVEELLAFNSQMLARHKKHAFFQLFTDGSMQDPAKRQRLFACGHSFSRHFQTMLYTRHAHCADPRYLALFERHLREEAGHDEILRKKRERPELVWDPIMDSAAAWFISRMSILDNVEKLAVIHLVLETSGAYMGSVSGPVMREYGAGDYFELHDEVDQSHVTMALEPLGRQTPETLARVRVVIEQAWIVLDMWFERLADVAVGVAPITYYPAIG